MRGNLAKTCLGHIFFLYFKSFYSNVFKCIRRFTFYIPWCCMVDYLLYIQYCIYDLTIFFCIVNDCERGVCGRNRLCKIRPCSCHTFCHTVYLMFLSCRRKGSVPACSLPWLQYFAKLQQCGCNLHCGDRPCLSVRVPSAWWSVLQGPRPACVPRSSL